MVENVAHVNEGVRRTRATRPWLTGGANLGQGVSKLIIRLSYNILYLVYLYKCGCGNDRDDLNDQEWVVRNVRNN